MPRFLAVIAFFWVAVPNPAAQADIVIVTYHRFGEADYPSTNIKLEQFEQHLTLLQDGGYSPLSLFDLERVLKQAAVVPDKGIIITVDDAYRSFMTQAWPRLKAAGIPVTLFVSTQAVDRAKPGSRYLTWDEIRVLQAEGVHIGHHGGAHVHLPRLPRQEAIADISRASATFLKQLGAVPTMFSYPYGEFDAGLAGFLEDQGFSLAFGQFSSAIDSRANPYALPRFAINERYGDLARFRLVSQVLALPVKDILPQDPQLTAADNPPMIGFTVMQEVAGIEALQCYPSHLGKAARLEALPSAVGDKRLEIRFAKPFPQGRSRLNCTMQHRSGRWYWFGMPFFVPGGRPN